MQARRVVEPVLRESRGATAAVREANGQAVWHAVYAPYQICVCVSRVRVCVLACACVPCVRTPMRVCAYVCHETGWA